MESGAGSEIRKRVGGHFSGEEGGVGVQGSEEGVVGSYHPISAVTIRGLPPPSTAKQELSYSTRRLSNDQYSKIDLCRVVSSPPAAATRLWSFGSAEISLTSATADISILKGQPTGMNRWKGDARKPVEVPEIGGGKADSADSSFGSSLSKKPKSDFKLRANQALKTQVKENLTTSPSKQSMSHNNEVGSPLDLQRERDVRKQAIAVPGELLFPEKPVFAPQKVEQESVPQEQVFDMQHIRSTILKQEAVFREQVRELHRVHEVQTHLMAEMRKKEFDLIGHSTGTNVGGPSQGPAVFAMNPGTWNFPMGQVLVGAGNDYEASIALPDTLKGGTSFRPRDSPMSRPLLEANLFKQSPRVRPVRRTFDLERPPDDDDEEQVERKENDSMKPEGNRLKLMESSESCTNATENNDMFSLHLSTGFGGGGGKAVKEDRDYVNRVESDVSRVPKRPREEAALFPFIATKSEGLRDAPLRPTPTAGNQNFLGGLWGLQLGRKVDGAPTPDRNFSPEESEAPKKKERLSFNLEVEEKDVALAASNGAPHWLLKVPAAKPPKKAVCQTESSSLNVIQDSFSPPRNSSEQGVLKPFPQNRGESGSRTAPGMGWDAERRVADNPPSRNRSQASHDGAEMAEDNMQGGARGGYHMQVGVRSAYQTLPMNVAPKEYGSLRLAQGDGEAPVEALSLYSSWREVGDANSDNISHGVLTQGHPVAAPFGVRLRAKVMSPVAHRTSQVGTIGLQNNVSVTVAPMAQQEGVDDADGGSSDAGSGGSGVGDVINPGDGASPSIETFVQGGGSSNNLPAGEGEEGVNMGELGLQADSESQSGRFTEEEKPRKSESQGQLSGSLGFRSSLSMVARKISRENSDGPGHVVDNSQKCVRGTTEGLSEEVENRAAPPVVFHHVLEKSGSSSGAIMNLLAKESQSHGLCPQQSLEEFGRNAQMEQLQQSTCSTSQSRRIHPSKMEDSLKKGKETPKGAAESTALGLGTIVSREQYRGREAMDIDDAAERGKTHVGQRNGSFSNFGDISRQERESNGGHSKQLSGANTSEKGGVQHKPYSPVLRQVPSPSPTVDLERHAEGS